MNEATDCSANTFWLSLYLAERLVAAVAANLTCLYRLLKWNATQGLLFFRMSSSIVPFDSHETNTFPRQQYFGAEFRALDNYIEAHGLRISPHPDQFVVLNLPSPAIVQRSIEEMIYQGSILNLVGLDSRAELQIHVGGLCGDRELTISQFEDLYTILPAAVRARIIVEDDDHLFPLRDCLDLHARTGVPIPFDSFHHECPNHGKPMHEALLLATTPGTPPPMACR